MLLYIHLLYQVCSELENHVGIGDKTLAEFIIDLAKKNPNLQSFQRALESNGAEFPDSFVSTLHALIQRLLPKKAATATPGAPSSAGKTAGAASDAISARFPGLAIPDTKPIRLSPSPPRARDRDGGSDRDRDRDRDRGRDRDRFDEDRRQSGGSDRDRERRAMPPPPPPPPVSSEPQLYQVCPGPPRV